MHGSYNKKYRHKSGNGKYRPAPNKGIGVVTVRSRPGKASQGLLCVGGAVFPCALGRGGISATKREGDGATPLARMRLISGYFRSDHVARRPTRLAMKPIRADLGWCDAPLDGNYNRPVRTPFAASHEKMLRADRLYDFCIVLDWNVSQRRRGCGSAIFFHLARPGFTPTEGCVAVTARVMARLLPYLSGRTVLEVRR